MPENFKERIGLSTTRVRLRELFGQSADLNIRHNDRLSVEIAIPFQTAT